MSVYSYICENISMQNILVYRKYYYTEPYTYIYVYIKENMFIICVNTCG